MDPGTERRRSQLANACRLLETAGEKTPMALGMVRRLVGVLRRHRVHGVEQGGSSKAPAQGGQQSLDSGSAYAAGSSSVEHQQVPGGETQMPGGFEASGFQAPANWVYDPAMDPNGGLTGIWNDFLGTDPSTNNGWEQLFSELDYLSGGM